MNILCLIKTTQYEEYRQNGRRRQQWKNLPQEYQEALLQVHHEHGLFVEKFKVEARRQGLHIEYLATKNFKTCPKQYEIVITLGGDGVFLTAAQHCQKSILLGFNSRRRKNPKQGSIGALCLGDEQNMRQLLKAINTQKYHITEWYRLYVSKGGRKIFPGAINDVYIGSMKAYKASDVEIEYKGKKDRFSCSGIVVSTAAGSKAWWRSMMLTPFNDTKTFAFVIREPNRDRKPLFQTGKLKLGEELIVRPGEKGYVVSFDSKNNTQELQMFEELRIGLDQHHTVKLLQI